MKKQALITLLMLMFSMVCVMAEETPGKITVAFKKGNAEDLGKLMEDKVELTVPETAVKVMSRQDAVHRLRGFFAVNGVEDFKMVHQGKRNDSGFVIGTLSTRKGKFRVNCFLKKAENLYLISQIRINKINE